MWFRESVRYVLILETIRQKCAQNKLRGKKINILQIKKVDKRIFEGE